jgi:hypothetical protein
LRLDHYCDDFEAQGYDCSSLILSFQHDPQGLEDLAKHTGMKPGHVARLKLCLKQQSGGEVAPRNTGDGRGEPQRKISRH